MPDPAPTHAHDIAWDIEPLVDGDGAAGVDRLLDQAQQRADALAAAHEGHVAELDGEGLKAVVDELQQIGELAGRAGVYAMLRFSVDTLTAENGALVARVQERSTAIETRLLFFELEWAALDDAKVEQLLAADGLQQVQHHLRASRRYRPHLLTAPEEKILAEASVTGTDAWQRLFGELTSAIEVTIDGHQQPLALDAAAAMLSSPDREQRAHVAAAITAALQPTLRTRAFVLNTLLADKSTSDRLRSYPRWISSRNLANETSDASVDALIEAVRGDYETARRWYRLKAQLLGLDRLADYDRLASVGTAEPSYSWDQARTTVLESFGDFSPQMAEIAQRFFDERWIDAPTRPGKRGGAFCMYSVPSRHPYVMLNFTAKRRDVLVLAHELGHGIHAYLSRERGIFEHSTPLTLAETASVFAEALVFRKLLAEADSDESRLALLAENIEGSIATVYRQVAFNRFETLMHSERRDVGELSVERFGQLWTESQRELLGDAVEFTPGYDSWWSYIPHFINSPGYVYAYAYGQLLALSVYGRYLDQGEAFVPKYIELLRTGGSQAPEQLVAIAGLDLTDPGFWRGGLALVGDQLRAAEQAATGVLAARPQNGNRPR